MANGKEEPSLSLPTDAPFPNLNYEVIKSEIVWRAISYSVRSGGMNWFRTEVEYDDYMLTRGIGAYFREIENRRVDRITFHRIGPFSQVLGSNQGHRKGSKQIAHERKMHKLEEFGIVMQKKTLMEFIK